MKNSKAILVKTLATVALTATGIVAINEVENSTADAAVVENDTTVYTVRTSTPVYSDYNTLKKTGQVLSANTDWKVIKTAYDSKGNKWYDLGKNQWVKVTNTAIHVKNKTQNSVVNTNKGYKSQTSSSKQTTSINTQTTSSAPTQSKTVNNTSTVTGSEANAKAWIASRESGGSYSANNGQYIGKYQLSASYLGGDYSAANQERAADNYVKSHYGSWSAAKSFWQTNGWY